CGRSAQLGRAEQGVIYAAGAITCWARTVEGNGNLTRIMAGGHPQERPVVRGQLSRSLKKPGRSLPQQLRENALALIVDVSGGVIVRDCRVAERLKRRDIPDRVDIDLARH